MDRHARPVLDGHIATVIKYAIMHYTFMHLVTYNTIKNPSNKLKNNKMPILIVNTNRTKMSSEAYLVSIRIIIH